MFEGSASSTSSTSAACTPVRAALRGLLVGRRPASTWRPLFEWLLQCPRSRALSGEIFRLLDVVARRGALRPSAGWRVCVAASSLWVLVCVRAGTLLCVAAVCAVCCVAVFVECAATDWGGDTVLLVTVSASCPLTGLLWERRCLISAAPVRAPCVRYPTTTTTGLRASARQEFTSIISHIS